MFDPLNVEAICLAPSIANKTSTGNSAVARRGETSCGLGPAIDLVDLGDPAVPRPLANPAEAVTRPDGAISVVSSTNDAAVGIVSVKAAGRMERGGIVGKTAERMIVFWIV